MRRITLALVMTLPVLILAGCGGSGAPVVLTGDYFPRTVGATWNYNVTTHVETANSSFSTTGSTTRRVLRRETLTINGRSVPTYVIGTTTTLASAPGPTFPVGLKLRPVIDYLYDATQGAMRPAEAHYQSVPFAPSGGTNETLVAMRYGTGPLLTFDAPLARWHNPPLIGDQHTCGTPLLPMPLAPGEDHVSDNIVYEKTVDYDEITTFFGRSHAIFFFERYEGFLNWAGERFAYSGRSRYMMQDIYGLVDVDWAITISDGSQWVRVSHQLAGQTYTP